MGKEDTGPDRGGGYQQTAEDDRQPESGEVGRKSRQLATGEEEAIGDHADHLELASGAHGQTLVF